MKHAGRRHAGAVMALTLCLAAPHAVTADDSLGDLSGPWILFVDDDPVSAKADVTRTYHSFKKYAGNPVLTPTEAWEDSIVYIYGTVLPQESGTGLRMWYHTMRPEDTNNDGSNILYATSPDGIHWTKPNLGIRSWHGSTANNMIFVRPGQSGITSVIHTPWEADSNRRYKLMNWEADGYWGAWSNDGVHTADCPNNPVLTGAGDVGQFNWDPHTQQYLGYVKLNSYVNGLKRRSVGLSATTDIQTWPAPALILEPDATDDRWVPAGTVQRAHLYGMSAFAYESMYIGFLWIFRATDVDGYYIGPVYAEIVSSHDGVHWIREEGDRPAILPLGPSGAWDDGQLYTAIAPVLRDGLITIYYGACDNVHGTATKQLNCSIGLATLRKDGFASLDAGANPGTVTTKSLSGASGALHVNYAASGGWLKVEVLDASGNVIPGYGQSECTPLGGDSLDQIVTWGTLADLPTGVGPLRLRFILQNASLYSFMAGGAGQPAAITQQPLDQQASAGSTVIFSVAASGTGPLSYRWQKNGLDLTDGGHYGGAMTATLAVSNVDVNDIADYRCTVSNPYGAPAVSREARLNLGALHFVALGVLPGRTTSAVMGVSADGSVLCGTSTGRAFIWTSANGMKDLGVPSGATASSAAGVGILNGGTVVAVNTDAASSKARRWDGNTAGVGTYSPLPKMDGSLEWTATGLGTNGTSDLWIAGSSPSGGDGGGRQAGRYRQSTGTTDTLALPANGHDHSDFHAASDNGAFAGQYQYKGTAPTGGARNAMKGSGSSSSPLNTLLGAPTTTYEAVAKAISRDGLVLGGWSYYSGGGAYSQPAIWSNSSIPTAVPFIPDGDHDNFGEVFALNGAGTLAGGYSCFRGSPNPDGPKEAFIWDAANGTRSYQSVCTQLGLNLSGWSLQEIRGLSADGKVVAGNGLHNGVSEGWVVQTARYTPAVPTITQQPQSQQLCPDGTATFTVAATGEGSLAYRWQKNATNLDDGGHYAGTRTAALTISHADSADAGSYRCIVAVGDSQSTSGTASLSLRPLVQADFDRDCDVDAADLDLFAHCAAGADIPYAPTCTLPPDGQGLIPADFDDDGDVDQADFGTFQRCLTGPDIPADPTCTQ